MWPFSRKRAESNEAKPSESNKQATSPPVVCSFCSKTQEQVRKIIAGPTVYICDECIDLCNDIIAEECDHEEVLSSSSNVSNPPENPMPGSISDRQPPRVGGQPYCILCRLPKDNSDLLWILQRGLLCSICLEAILVTVQIEET